MNRKKAVVRCLVVLGALLAARIGVSARAADTSSILEFKTMFPVTAPYTGTTNPIRGIPGAGLPWTIGSAQGELKADGRLEIEVNGLVLAQDPAVPVALQLTNPLPSFRAAVSCLSIDSNKMPSTVNVSTDAFPATPSGDSSIETTVSLPSPCIAQIVFVTTPRGMWLAATGR